jgi:hypothetical protein
LLILIDWSRHRSSTWSSNQTRDLRVVYPALRRNKADRLTIIARDVFGLATTTLAGKPSACAISQSTL